MNFTAIKVNFLREIQEKPYAQVYEMHLITIYNTI